MFHKKHALLNGLFWEASFLVAKLNINSWCKKYILIKYLLIHLRKCILITPYLMQILLLFHIWVMPLSKLGTHAATSPAKAFMHTCVHFVVPVASVKIAAH